MPKARSILTGEEKSGCFHCVSRVVDRKFVLQERERERFAELLRAVEKFSGVGVLTWTMLSNHFHVVVEVPAVPAEPLSDREFWQRLRAMYSPLEIRNFKQAMSEDPKKMRAKFLARMWNLSEFMKTLRLRYSKWFNSSHQRRGTLWEERFRATRVEGSCAVLPMVCAYVDLNAVRAGIVEDPADYRWSGFGEAMAGKRPAQAGLRRAWNMGADKAAGWGTVRAGYQRFLYGVGEDESGTRRDFSPERIRKVWESGGQLSVSEMLHCRLRFISDGLVIGSESYLGEYLASYRRALGIQRKGAGGKPTRGDWEGLCSFRRPQLDALRPPSAESV